MLNENLYAQRISFRLMQDMVMEAAALKDTFGGISGIELMPDALVYRAAKTKLLHPNSMSLILVSDHYPNKPSNGEQRSYFFEMDNDFKIHNGLSFAGFSNVECIRYNPTLNKVFYCAEKDDNSEVGYIDIAANGTLTTTPFFTESNFSHNRGIEGITFTSDNNLWIANESGSKDLLGNVVPFYRIKPDKTTLKYDSKSAVQYQYPFDKCRCLDSCRFDGNYGSGVSEILALKDKPDQLMVLERCFNGRKDFVSLYLAKVEPGSNILSKQLVFNLNDYFTPDNIEGMAWGSDENGSKILYLVSDDNFNTIRKIQKNQVIKLKLIEEKP
jgi:hypothetical protein